MLEWLSYFSHCVAKPPKRMGAGGEDGWPDGGADNRGLDGMHGMRCRHVQLMKEALSRALWLVLLVAHARALIAAWRYSPTNGFTVEVAGVCILLTAATVLFALKLGGVPWLRFRCDRRSFVAVCLILAIVHLDCFRPGTRQALVSRCVVVLAAAPLVTVVPRVARVLCAERTHGASPRRLRLSDVRRHEEARFAGFRPHCAVLASHLFMLRAPPG